MTELDVREPIQSACPYNADPLHDLCPNTVEKSTGRSS